MKPRPQKLRARDQARQQASQNSLNLRQLLSQLRTRTQQLNNTTSQQLNDTDIKNSNKAEWN